MTITIELSEGSINRAIRKLETYRDDLSSGVKDFVETLVHKAAEEAQNAYGDWGVEAVPSVEQDSGDMDATGFIDVIGDMPLIAEFGAGDATEEPTKYFENSPDTDVFPGSYSLLEGSREYYTTGVWHFGAKEYHEIPPRLGLYKAKQYIIDHSTDVAREVFGND